MKMYHIIFTFQCSSCEHLYRSQVLLITAVVVVWCGDIFATTCDAGSIMAVFINPLRPNNDLSQTSYCNIKGVSVSEVMRIENKITPVKFY